MISLADSVEEGCRLLRVSSVNFSINHNGNKSMSHQLGAHLHLLQSTLTFFSDLSKGVPGCLFELSAKAVWPIKMVSTKQGRIKWQLH